MVGDLSVGRFDPGHEVFGEDMPIRGVLAAMLEHLQPSDS